MKERVFLLEQRVRSCITKTRITSSILFNNSDVLWELAQIIYDNLILCEPVDIDMSLVKKTSLTDCINLINGYCRKYGIDLDVNKLIDNGTIDFFYQKKFLNEFEMGYGKNYCFDDENNYKAILSTNYGNIFDSEIVIHEISHYRNQPDDYRSEVNHLLTESIAIAEELIFNEYLAEVGYNYESEMFKQNFFNFVKLYMKDSVLIFKMCNLFNTFSNLSRENYELLYDGNDYESDIIESENILNKYGVDLYREGWYTLGYALAVYMYVEFKRNNKFMNNIQALHNLINNKSFISCLKEIGLCDLGPEDQEKIALSFHEIKKELKINSKVIKK